MFQDQHSHDGRASDTADHQRLISRNLAHTPLAEESLAFQRWVYELAYMHEKRGLANCVFFESENQATAINRQEKSHLRTKSTTLKNADGTTPSNLNVLREDARACGFLSDRACPRGGIVRESWRGTLPRTKPITLAHLTCTC
jgi:hypothetical protein